MVAIYVMASFRGVGIFLTKKLDYKVHDVYYDDKGNLILIDLTSWRNQSNHYYYIRTKHG